jgi:excisionase family DNA binding protein
MIQTTVLQVQQINADTLLLQIDGLIENRLKSFSPKPSTPQDTEEFLTREEVAKLFKISFVTLHDWTNKGLLNAYRIGNKVRYRKSEVMQSPKAINNAKEGVKP